MIRGALGLILSCIFHLSLVSGLLMINGAGSKVKNPAPPEIVIQVAPKDETQPNKTHNVKIVKSMIAEHLKGLKQRQEARTQTEESREERVHELQAQQSASSLIAPLAPTLKPLEQVQPKAPSQLAKLQFEKKFTPKLSRASLSKSSVQPATATAKLPPAPQQAKNDKEAVASSPPKIDYPRSCRRLKHEGVVSLLLEINSSGVVTAAHLSESSGCDEMDRSAQAAALRQKYEPAIRNDKAVASVLLLRMHYSLQKP